MPIRDSLCHHTESSVERKEQDLVLLHPLLETWMGLSVPTVNEALETTVMTGKHSFALQLRNQRHGEEKDLLSSQNW